MKLLEQGLAAFLFLLFAANSAAQPVPEQGIPQPVPATNSVPLTNPAAARTQTIRVPRAAAGQTAPPAFPVRGTVPAPVPTPPTTAGGLPAESPGSEPIAADEDLLSTNPEPAAMSPGADLPVILRFKNAPLEQIFDLYSQLTGRVVLYPTQLQTQAITVSSSEINLTPLEAINAIEGALSLNGVTLIPLGERFTKAVPAAQSIQEAPPINRGSAKDLPEAEQFITQVVPLKVVPPSEVAAVFATFSKTPGGIIPIDASMILVLRDYASNIKRMMELIEQIDVQPESAYVLEVVPIKYGKVEDFFNTMNSLIGGSAGASGVPVTGS
jgi:hypothetical protein